MTIKRQASRCTNNARGQFEFPALAEVTRTARGPILFWVKTVDLEYD